MSLSIIVAKASNNAIGKDNALLWHLSDDLKRFKKLTMGHPIIMGRKTFESLPGVLPGRVHYVLTGNKDYKAPEGVLLFHDVKSLMESLPEGENFVIGGEHMYKALLPYAGALYITEVEKPFDGDAFFPEIRPEDWVVTEETEGEGNIPTPVTSPPVAVDAERGPRQELNARPAIIPHINPQHFIFIIIIFLRFYVYSFLS